MLKVLGLTTSHTLKDVSVKASQTGLVHLIGRNGAGKSTLLNAISGFEVIEQGQVWLGESKLNSVSLSKWVSQLSYFTQDYDNPFNLSAEQLAEIHDIDVHSHKKLFDGLGLDGIFCHAMTRLSGGEQQRCMLFITLAQHAAGKRQLLMLDEPFNHMDIQYQSWLWHYLHQLKEQCLVLIAHHQINQALKSDDELWLVYQGKIKAYSKQNQVSKALLGQAFNVPEQQFVQNTSGFIEFSPF